MKSARSPVYYGHAIVDGVWRFVRRWIAGGPLEIISDEELKREHEEEIVSRARRAGVDLRSPEEKVSDEEFEMSRRIAEWKKRHTHI